MSRRAGFAPVSNLIGTPILDLQGLVVGHVMEFLVDEDDGRIAYVEFDFRPGKRGPERRITVPWSTIRPSSSGWQLRVGRATLDSLSRPQYR
jgi:sporulation protein YlmC with PRC-barrel domain